MTISSAYLIDYVYDGFGYIDCVFDIISWSKLQDRKATKLNIAIKHEGSMFHPLDLGTRFHHTISNIYFNNNQKTITGSVHEDNIVFFKKKTERNIF